MKTWDIRHILRTLFLIIAVALPSTARADVLYGVTFSNQLITIDPNTGAGTLVGNLDSNMQPYGIAALNGNLYVFDQVAKVVRQIDPATAHSLVTIQLGAIASNLVGEGDITFRGNGTGFISTATGGGSSVPSLLSFIIGSPPAVNVGNLLPAVMDGLAFDSNNTLYGLKQGNSSPVGGFLYRINPTNAVTTLVGGPLPATTDAVFGGLAFRGDGTLFAEMSNNSSYSDLFIVNPATGSSSLVGQITGFNDVTGLAFLSGLGTAPEVPEPSSFALITIGLAACTVVVRTRRRS